jgi:hypothetical protein
MMKRLLMLASLLLLAAQAQAASQTKVDVSGYLQSRWTTNQGPDTAWDNNTFDIRRARLKVVGRPSDKVSVTFQTDLAEGDAETKDLFVTLQLSPLTAVSFGQMKIPFSAAIIESSQDRLVPERSTWAGVLFSNQRDRGVKVVTRVGEATVTAGAFNGTGVNTKDTNPRKDYVVRLVLPAVGGQLGFSGYFGTDTNDGRITKDQKLGADLKVVEGPLTLTGEYVLARQFLCNPSGWEAQAALAVGAKNTLVCRFDTFLPDGLPGINTGRVNSWNAGVVHTLDKSTKLKLFYTRRHEAFNGKDNDVITAEVLVGF